MKAHRARRRRSARPAPAPLARYLVAIDFSPASGRALERAIRLAAVNGGEVHLVHVEAPGTPRAVGEKARSALAKATAAACNGGRRSGARGVRATCSVRIGDPHVEIIRCAREIGADIVVMGRAGAGGRRRQGIGTTAARVVRMSAVPTLLVGQRVHGPYRRPLIAVETDPSARDIMELAHRVVGSNAVAMRIIHAYRVPFESYFLANPGESAATYFRAARKTAAESIVKLVEAIGWNQRPLEMVLRRGDPRRAIAAEAARCGADLIALGTHGRSGVAHALLGSVAESVIGNTSRDVLVGRPVHFTFTPP